MKKGTLITDKLTKLVFTIHTTVKGPDHIYHIVSPTFAEGKIKLRLRASRFRVATTKDLIRNSDWAVKTQILDI